MICATEPCTSLLIINELSESTGFQGGNVVYGIFYYFSLDIESRKFHPEIL